MQTYIKGGIAYDVYGNPLGAAPSAPVTPTPQHSQPTPPPAAQHSAPTPLPVQLQAPSNPRDPAFWTDWRARARAGTQGVNRMPGIFSNYSGAAQADPMDVLRMLFPQAADSARIGLNGGVPFAPQAAPAPSTASNPAQPKSNLMSMLGMAEMAQKPWWMIANEGGGG